MRLTTEQLEAAMADYMRDASSRFEPITLTKPDLRKALAAVDVVADRESPDEEDGGKFAAEKQAAIDSEIAKEVGRSLPADEQSRMAANVLRSRVSRRDDGGRN